MKKIIIIASLVIMSSCGNNSTNKKNENGILESIISKDNVPKCEDQEVTETVAAILLENRNSLITKDGRNGVLLNEKDIKINNIMTTNINNELKSCNCEGAVLSYISGIDMTTEGNVIYTAQINSEGAVVVKVEDAGPFTLKL